MLSFRKRIKPRYFFLGVGLDQHALTKEERDSVCAKRELGRVVADRES